MRRIFIHFDSLGRAIDTVVGGSIRGPGSAVATDGTLGMASEETVRILLRPNLPQSRILAAALDRPRAAYLPEERKSNAKVNSTFGDEVASGRGSILPTGNFKRPFTALLSDGENRIWARRSVSSVKETSLRSATNPMGIREPFVFDAFQTNGTFLGEVTFPALAPSLRISFAGSTAWAVVNGADDEPFLVRFRFR